MTKIIDEQENTLTQGQIAKKDEIIAQADAQNEAYQWEIEELDRLIAAKRQEDLDIKDAIAEEKKLTRKQIEVLDNEIQEVQQETQLMKTKYQEKIKLARGIQDEILHERVQTQGLLKIFQ